MFVLARLLNQRRGTVAKSAARMGEQMGLQRPEFYVEDEASCNAYDPEFAAFVSQCWDDLTRTSECQKDEARDPVADCNGVHQVHRIHWVNTRVDDMVAIIIALGQERFNESGKKFHLSKKKLLNLKKYYHR